MLYIIVTLLLLIQTCNAFKGFQQNRFASSKLFISEIIKYFKLNRIISSFDGSQVSFQ